MRRHAKADGYTLVELLIAMAIVGVIAGAVVGVQQVSQDIYTRAAALEDAQLGARAGLDRMANELRLTGSFWFGASGAGNAITAATATCISFRADIDADTLSAGNSTGQEITLTAQAVSGSNSISVNQTTGWTGRNAFAAGEWVHIANGARREVKQIGAYENGTSIPLATPLIFSFPISPQPATVRSVEAIKYYLDGTDLRRKINPSSPCASPETINGPGIVENVNNLSLTYFGRGIGANGATENPLGSPPDLTQIREIQIRLTTQGDGENRRTMTSRVRLRNLP